MSEHLVEPKYVPQNESRCGFCDELAENDGVLIIPINAQNAYFRNEYIGRWTSAHLQSRCNSVYIPKTLPERSQPAFVFEGRSKNDLTLSLLKHAMKQLDELTPS